MTDASKRGPGRESTPEAHGVATWQRHAPIGPGLWIVATPIGNARDITLHALDILAGADVLVCEDTRRTRRLLDIHGIATGGRPVLSYNDQNGEARRETVIGHLRDNATVAYCSDAGTPLIADPGYRLVEAARSEGLPVHTAPGASAVLTALSIAGLPTDRFLFAGFLPRKQGQRLKELETLATVSATLVVFETGRRLRAALEDIVTVFGAAHRLVVARELTKKFEEVLSGPAGELAAQFAADGDPKGEIVLLIDRRTAGTMTGSDIEAMLEAALAGNSVRDAARIVAEATGRPRRDLYTMALALASDEN